MILNSHGPSRPPYSCEPWQIYKRTPLLKNLLSARENKFCEEAVGVTLTHLLNIMMKSEFVKVNFFFLTPNFRDTHR